ncbi:MAG TPA: asparagine synthase (glutamine-hydrolyzing) [Gaiellaceae bacterium]|nr:asparagine synthase (glutamine-hydrolyzing) [Gaiellaceae bacterium]
MCGVCGILATSDLFDASPERVDEMRDAVAHRGPDDAATWVAPGGRVAFGHRRLSIVDLSPAGRNPMSNEDSSVWITYNGEVYNHRELRHELERKGHLYRSQTDTETILHLYEEEGPRCVERLHGMFAFAIWDERRRELFLARDRLGVKPLYFARPDGGFVFASEIKALLRHPAVRRDLDEESFFDYLTFAAPPAPRTMFAGISKLRPAERMTVRADGSVSSEIWWSPFNSDAEAAVEGAGDAELEARLLELLRESIRKRMMADVPFGVFLSGGVDSSLNVALMSELDVSPVRTFSVGFAGEDETNEFVYARTIADRFGTDHHEVVLDAQEALESLPELVHHQDEPIADYTCIPMLALARLARSTGTIVVQVGEGSDELFHGYEHYVEHARVDRALRPRLQRIPKPLLRGAATAASRVSERVGRGATRLRYLEDAAADRRAFWGGAVAFAGGLKQRVVAAPAPDAYRVVDSFWREAERERPGADTLQKMTYIELKHRLAELLLMRVDKMTMAASVEARVPFLDHRLVEFALALPPSAKVNGGQGKVMLKRVAANVLPPEIVNRRKQGFYTPMADWLRGDFGVRAREEVRRSSLAERGLLDYDRIDRLWDAHRRGTANWAFQLWNVWNVSAWHDLWIAGSRR